MNIIVAGIHTGIGKTVCASIMTEALEYDYWKPIQAGDLDASDSFFVANHIANANSIVHKEAYRFTVAASPHWAAQQEGINMVLEKLRLPGSKNLIIETAGGVMSPLNQWQTNLDLIRYFNIPVVLVCHDYLGSINHSLLSIEAMRNKGVAIMGIIFCGNEISSTREYILQYSGLPLLFSVPWFTSLDKMMLCSYAASITSTLKKCIHEFNRKG